jgi:hypothetical protein
MDLKKDLCWIASDSGYKVRWNARSVLPMVVYYYRHPPIILNEDFTPRLPIQPDPRLLEAVKQLGALVDFLVITANGPSLVQEQLEQAASRKVLA